MKRILFNAMSTVLVLLFGCGNLQTYTTLEQPVNTTLRANVGQKIWRMSKTRDLPNAFGKADLFGRTVDAGYEELRFLGMEGESLILFGYREQEIYSNETTMSRSRVGYMNLQTFGNTTTGTVVGPPSSTTQMVTPYEVVIKHDLRKDSSFAHSGVRVLIQKATPNEVTYSLGSE